MSENNITCPQCGFEFEATAVLSAKIKHDLEAQFITKSKQAEQELSLKTKAIEAQAKQLQLEKQQNEELIQTEVNAEQEKGRIEMNKKWTELEAELKKKLETGSRSKVELELKDLQAQNDENKRRVAEANTKELELRKLTRDLEEKQKNSELELQRRLDQERQAISTKVRLEADEAYRLKSAEKDKQLEQLQRSLDDAQRKASQGSMQIQGDVQENELKQILTQSFPYDQITDVATGTKGADLVHQVFSNVGQNCGVIIWESKRTKAWSDDWVKKLKDDQAATQADVAILATQVMPSDLKTYGFYKGVWVVHYDLAHILALTGVLRHQLQEIHSVKNSMVGRDEKMEYLYGYLSGSQFKNKIENIVSAFTSMKEDLESEKRAMTKIWAKRDKEITRVIDSTAGMYGDLQGIIGGSLGSIAALELGGGEKDGELF